MMLPLLCFLSACCAVVPCVLTLLNLREYLPPPDVSAVDPLLRLAVLIPARNEEEGISACVESVLASVGVDLEVIVLDDASTDRTASIVAALATQHQKLKVLSSAALPAGWNGKQHACWQAAQAAGSPLLCFLDADVRLQPDALARIAGVLLRERVALVSGFPRELTGTWLEKLLIPLIHFVLMGLLPMRMLRTTTKPGFAAGCGQFLMVDREAYFLTGGHSAIRQTMHDGLLLPRLFRQHGYSTRLVDLTTLASCRMYRSASTTWNGLAKNATEGFAAPARIVPMTLFFALGQVLPLLLLWTAWQRTIVIIPFLGPSYRINMLPVWVAAVAVLSAIHRVSSTRFATVRVGSERFCTRRRGYIPIAAMVCAAAESAWPPCVMEVARLRSKLSRHVLPTLGRVHDDRKGPDKSGPFLQLVLAPTSSCLRS